MVGNSPWGEIFGAAGSELFKIRKTGPCARINRDVAPRIRDRFGEHDGRFDDHEKDLSD
jgi:hypothetical protein